MSEKGKKSCWSPQFIKKLKTFKGAETNGLKLAYKREREREANVQAHPD